jgi:Uma2 family endonuclease
MNATLFPGLLPGDSARRLFTVEDVGRMAETGILHEDEPIELLAGELLVVSPQDPSRAAAVADLHERLANAYRDGYHVRNQLPLIAGVRSLPEPDLAVVVGRPREYRDHHPVARQACLVVEVARTSQALDRWKAGIYAAAGAPVYWLIDLAARRIEVLSSPSSRGVYEVRRVLSPGEDFDQPGLDVRWPVADLVG